jgi:hypothetical protein
VSTGFWGDIFPFLNGIPFFFPVKTIVFEIDANPRRNVWGGEGGADLVKPEARVNASGRALQQLNVTDHLMKRRDMFIGPKAEKIFEERCIDRDEFLKKVEASYITLAEYLLAKMPINSTLLQHLSALDPVARGHTPALTFMKGLPKLVTMWSQVMKT